MQKLKISFQFVNGEKHILEVESSSTVAELKEKIYNIMKEESKIEPKDQRFIYLGKILKDGDTLESVEGLKDNSTIFVMGKSKKQESKEEKVKSKEQVSQMPPQNFQNQNNFMQPDMMGNLGQSMNNPSFVNNMISQSIEHLEKNPAMLDLYYGQSMQGMSESQKEAWRQQMINQLKELQKNPQFLQNAMNAMPEMGNFGRQQPQFNMHQQFNQQQVPCSHGYYPLGYVPPMNPYYSPQHMSPNLSFNNEDVNFNEIFAEQLVLLEEMGFSNKKLNIEALKKTNGDVTKAANLLCDWNKGNN